MASSNDEWAAYWPEHADQPFGDVVNSIKKYVVSNSLQTAEWQNSEIINGDAAQELTDIKAEDRGDINMSGSATTVRWLLREGLLDELNLLVHPILVGHGLARLFPPDEPSIPLELLSVQTFKTGVLNLSYAPARTEPNQGKEAVDGSTDRCDRVRIARRRDAGARGRTLQVPGVELRVRSR
jgi:dihydrofolate reductase